MPYHTDKSGGETEIHDAQDSLLTDGLSRVMWILVPVLIGGVISMFSNFQQDVQIIVWGVMFIIIMFGLWFHQARVLRKKREVLDRERWQKLTDGLDQQFGKVDEQFSNVGKRFDEIDRRFDESDKTDRTLLRNELVANHRIWVEEKGYITLEALEYIDETYEEYSAKGGNSSGTKLWKDMHDLPLRENRAE